MSDIKVSISNWGEVALDKRGLRALMRGASSDVRSKTARLINASTGAGRTYRGGGGNKYRGAYVAGPYTASAPGEPPVRVSGTLRESLKAYVYKSGEGFAVRARMFYALFLEAGAKGGSPRAPSHRARRSRRAGIKSSRRTLDPRPFLDRVMQQEEQNLQRRTVQAMREGLTWKQTK